MKHLIIIGAGGMGRSVYWIASESIGYGTDFDIKGFIDDDLSSMDGFDNYPPLLGTIEDYKPAEDDVFTCSIGNVSSKHLVCDKLKQRGAIFKTLIHRTASIQGNTKLGDGCVVCTFALISNDAVIGENCLIQAFSTLGHDCSIGNYVRIDPHAVIVGGVIIKDRATIHTGAVVSHQVVVGEDAVVAACSFVIKEVDAGTTVFGNPAKSLPIFKR